MISQNTKQTSMKKTRFRASQRPDKNPYLLGNSESEIQLNGDSLYLTNLQESTINHQQEINSS